VLAAKASALLGKLRADEVARIEQLLQRAGLPTTAPELGFARWMELMAQDKKVLDGRIRFVLMDCLGQSELAYLDEAQLRELLH